eukprot:365389-Chlamydomonas_euryale.AAC.8
MASLRSLVVEDVVVDVDVEARLQPVTSDNVYCGLALVGWGMWSRVTVEGGLPPANGGGFG